MAGLGVSGIDFIGIANALGEAFFSIFFFFFFFVVVSGDVSFDAATLTFSGTPGPGSEGKYVVTVRAADATDSVEARIFFYFIFFYFFFF